MGDTRLSRSPVRARTGDSRLNVAVGTEGSARRKTTHEARVLARRVYSRCGVPEVWRCTKP